MDFFKRASKKKKIIIAVCVFILFAAFMNIMSSKSIHKNSSDRASVASTAISKSTAEKACQNVALLKTEGRNIDVIDILNYNAQFSNNDGTYTFTWNGKEGDSVKTFVCELTGTDGNPIVKSLDMDAEQLQ